MRIDLNSATNVNLFIDSQKIEGSIVEIDKTGKIFFELKEGVVTAALEIGKNVIISFNSSGKKCFVSGKMFFQPPHRIVITPETDVEEEKRADIRKEMPSLPAKIICQHKFFHHEEIKTAITDLSIKGARIETSKPLKEKAVYTLDTLFPYHHQQLSFTASFQIKSCKMVHTSFSYGIYFLEMDILSENNLKKYLFGEHAKYSFR